MTEYYYLRINYQIIDYLLIITLLLIAYYLLILITYYYLLFTSINQRAISCIECFDYTLSTNKITVGDMSDSKNSVVY